MKVDAVVVPNDFSVVGKVTHIGENSLQYKTASGANVEAVEAVKGEVHRIHNFKDLKRRFRKTFPLHNGIHLGDLVVTADGRLGLAVNFVQSAMAFQVAFPAGLEGVSAESVHPAATLFPGGASSDSEDVEDFEDDGSGEYGEYDDED